MKLRILSCTHVTLRVYMQRILLAGNPRSYALWKDESLNGVISNIAKGVHRRYFEARVFQRIHVLLRLGRARDLG